MKTKNKRIIYVATKKELMTKSYYRRLWIATRNIKIPRRAWLDEITDTLRDFDGVILHRSGKVFDMPMVDAVFGNDPDMRWFGYYLRPDRYGENPKSRSRKIERLRLLDLYFRIKHPEIAYHFGR